MFSLKRITVVVLIVTCFVKDSISLQRFAEQPKYTEVNPGEDALLTCKIIDKRGTCSWQKDNKPVGIYPKKYEWGGTPIGIQGHIGNDCSLWVRSATLDFDDGFWECQVTASDFTTQDALTSQPIRLVVRVAPQRPRLEHEGVHVPPGHNVTVDTSAVATVKCVSHYGNPPATLKWFLGEQEISALHPQTNSTEPDNPKTWSAASVVQIPASRERHGIIIKCVAFHESYTAKSVAVEARLDVKYAPTIRLLGVPQIDLEEGKDSLVLRCQADANPVASIVWRRAGRSEIASLQETLQLRPVGRRDAGLYTCQAQNSVGSSETLSVQLDIKYPPKITSAGPDKLTTAPLFTPAAFECVAEGNPPPTFKWVQRIRSQMQPYLERGRDSRLVIDNVTYDYQGEYECHATNFINGKERTIKSDPIALQVVGAPQVLRMSPSVHSVSVRKGDSAALSLIVCADPRPRHVAWEWGSLRLEAGAGIGRYRVDEVQQDSREDCYVATLHITEADPQDERPYYLVVENERGVDRHSIQLHVEEPFEMSYLMGIAGGCLAAFILLLCLCIYAVRAKKCCFKGRDSYKASEKDSEKADLKSRSDSLGGPQLDSIYTTPAGFHHNHHPHHLQPGQGSPEAMKSTTTQNGLRTPVLLHTTSTSTMNFNHPNHPIASDPNNADLVLGVHQRHHRDLFSGSLGIPDVSTHVGSVVHAFETMAMKRHNTSIIESGEKPYETGSSSKSVKSSTEPRRQNKIKLTKPPPPPPPKKEYKNQRSRSPFTTTNDQYDISSNNSMSLENDDYRKNLFTPVSATNHKMDSKIFQENLNLRPTQPSITVVPTLITPMNPNGKHTGNFGQTNYVSSHSQNKNINNNLNLDTNYNHHHHHHYDHHENNNNNDDDDDFIRGSTVSQSFIKNVVPKSKTNKFYNLQNSSNIINNNNSNNHNNNNNIDEASGLVSGGVDGAVFKRDRNASSTGRIPRRRGNELEDRYREYGGNGSSRGTKKKLYKPRTLDRANL